MIVRCFLFFSFFNILIFSSVSDKVVKLRNKNFNVYLYGGVSILDVFTDYKNTFNFNKIIMFDEFYYFKRFIVGTTFNININRRIEYNLCLKLGLGGVSFCGYAFALIFFGFYPIGFFYNIDDSISVGFNIGYDIKLNPVNKCRYAFYFNFKDVVFLFNIFRYKINKISFVFLKDIRPYVIVKGFLSEFFLDGWHIKFGGIF